jgi:hypothetical protein
MLLPLNDLGEKRTWPCLVCSPPDPHLPGPSDTDHDLRVYVPEPSRLAAEMHAEWLREAVRDG